MINKIFKITIYVNNQEEAKKFWVDKMGFEVKREENMMGEHKWLEVSPKDDDSTTFVLYDKNLMKSQNPSINVGHPSVMLYTKDIDKSHSDMKSIGIVVGEVMNYPYGRIYNFLIMMEIHICFILISKRLSFKIVFFFCFKNLNY